MSRIPMNSKSLQEHFPEVYKEFFSKYSLVVSAPNTFFWSGEHSVGYGVCPSITQQLPFRLYVGFEPIKDKTIEFGGLRVFMPYQQNFVERSYFNQFITSKLIDLLSPFISGVKIYILSESMPSCGLNSSGAFAGALATAINIFNKNISEETIKQWDNLTVDELIKKPELNFDNIFRLSWKIDAIFHADSSSGSGPFGVLVGAIYPMIFFTEERKGTYDNHPTKQPLDVLGHYEIFDQIQYWGYRMDELFKLPSIDQPRSVDFALIYSGNIKDTGVVLRSVVQISENLNQVNSFLKKIFSNFQNNDRAPLFIKESKKHDNMCFWYQYIETLMVTDLAILKSLEQVFRKGLSKQTCQEVEYN